jgi:hypothetical protein
VTNLQVSIDKPGAWVHANQTIDAGGRVIHALPTWVADCIGPPRAAGAQPGIRPVGPTADEACFARFAKLGYRQRVTYQAAGHYWTLQAYETAIFITLALLLSGFSLWWVRHRVS